MTLAASTASPSAALPLGYVRRREADGSSAFLAVFHHTFHGVRVAENLVCRLHAPLAEQVSHVRGALVAHFARVVLLRPGASLGLAQSLQRVAGFTRLVRRRGGESFRHAHGAALIGHHFEFEHAGGLGECANLLDVAFQIRAHARVLAKHEHAHAEFAHKLAEEESERFLGERDGIAHNEHIVDVHAAEHAQPRVHAGDGLRIMHAGRHVFACMCLCIGVHECRAWIEHDDHRVCVELPGLAHRLLDDGMVAHMQAVERTHRDHRFLRCAQCRPCDVAVRSWCQTKNIHISSIRFPYSQRTPLPA